MGLFGEALKKEIEASTSDIEMQIDGIIPKDSVTQFFAADGVGKSTLLLQVLLEASSGVPIFGEYETDRPLKILYIPTERPPRETYQRLIMMQQKIPVKYENFYFEPFLQGFDISNVSERRTIIEKIKEIHKEFGEIDWIHIDPAYAWTSQDLSTSTGAGEFNNLIRMIQKNVCKTVSYNHHTNRGVRDKEGQRHHEDMYGNRFLSANCTGIFHIKTIQGGTTFEKMKDSYSCLNKKIELTYDSLHYLSYVDASKTFTSKADRIVSFLKTCKSKKKTFTFDEFMTENNVSTAYARRHLSRHIILGNILVLNTNEKTHLHESRIG